METKFIILWYDSKGTAVSLQQYVKKLSQLNMTRYFPGPFQPHAFMLTTVSLTKHS